MAKTANKATAQKVDHAALALRAEALEEAQRARTVARLNATADALLAYQQNPTVKGYRRFCAACTRAGK